MKITRRYFFSLMAYATGGLLVLGSKSLSAAPKDAKIPDDYSLATTEEPLPKAMRYAEVAEKADAAVRVDKKAFCRNCSQYGKTHAEFKHPKDGKVATCELFVKGTQKSYVKNGGWCLGHQKIV
jgi:hypothetical protein